MRKVCGGNRAVGRTPEALLVGGGGEADGQRQPRPLKTRVKTEDSVCVAFINTDLFSQSLYKILRPFCTYLNDLLIVIL